MARYQVNNYSVEALLANIKSGEIAIPEIEVFEVSNPTHEKSDEGSRLL